MLWAPARVRHRRRPHRHHPSAEATRPLPSCTGTGSPRIG